MGLLLRASKEFGGDLLGEFDSLFGEEDGFGLTNWVGDQAFFVEALADVPIEGFPGSVVVGILFPRIYEKEGEGSFDDLGRVVIHAGMLAKIILEEKVLGQGW